MNNTGILILILVIGCLVALMIFLLIITITIKYKEKKKYEKCVEELKVGNKYEIKTVPACVVEIIDIIFDYKNEICVRYKQIEPECKDDPFSFTEPFKDFLEFFDLIK